MARRSRRTGALLLGLLVSPAWATNKWYWGCDPESGFCATFRLHDSSGSHDGTVRSMTACCGLEGCCCHSCSPACVPGAGGCCGGCCDQTGDPGDPAGVCCSQPKNAGPGTACNTASPPAGVCPGLGVDVTRITLVDAALNAVATLCDDNSLDPCPDNCDSPPITRIWTFGDGKDDVLTLEQGCALDGGDYYLRVEGAVGSTPIGGGAGLVLAPVHKYKPWDKFPLCPALGSTGLVLSGTTLLLAGIAILLTRRPLRESMNEEDSRHG